MKKSILFLLILTFTFFVTGCGQKTEVVNTDVIEEVNSFECIQLCNQAKEICPSLISLEQCQAACANWNKDTKEKISQTASCQELSEISEIIESLIPEMNDPELEEPASECEAACNNYVNQCLTLVPNATQALFQDGLNSCMEECAGWEETKVKCIKQSADCESMTNVCGL